MAVKGYKFASDVMVQFEHIKEDEMQYNPDTGKVEKASGKEPVYINAMKESFDIGLIDGKYIMESDLIISFPGQASPADIEASDYLEEAETEEVYQVVRELGSDPAEAVKKFHIRVF